MKQKQLLVFTLVFLLGCAPTVKKAYTKILKPCTTNDLTGSLLFFGPANNLGPGDALRKQSDGYGLSFKLPSMVEVEATRKAMLDISPPGQCEGSAELSKKLASKVAAENFVGEPQVSAKLNKAESITTSISSFKWVTLAQTLFETEVDNEPTDSRFRTTLLRDNSYVITRALLVEGMIVTYKFSQEIEAGAQGSYQQLSANLEGRWLNNTTFQLTVKEPFFIAGQLRQYTEDGVSEAQSRFGSVATIAENAIVTSNQPEIQ